MSKQSWFRMQIVQRNLIKKGEQKVSYLQAMGFFLIGSGILYITIFRGFSHVTSPDGIAVSFFIIMMGMCFAFPTLLEDKSKGLSTMRIVVFMMINVICMLLLKIGWNKNSLHEIGLDQYWVGVIAFVFGAKATQSFFESRMAILPQQKDSQKTEILPTIPSTSVDAKVQSSMNLTNAELAIAQNENDLRRQFPNIIKLLPAFYIDVNTKIPCVDICISDQQKQNIPPSINYRSNGKIAQIMTRIISNFKTAKPQVGRGDLISNNNFKTCLGTVACSVIDQSSSKKFLLTCNHVLNGGDFSDTVSKDDPIDEQIYGNYLNIGSWTAGVMNEEMDAGLVEPSDPSILDSNDIETTICELSQNDCGSILVELCGAISSIKQGYVIHLDQSFPFKYNNSPHVEIKHLISISATNNANDFLCITDEGDSGSLVYNKQTREPIGMVVGANDQFTYAIPIKAVLSAFKDYSLSIN